MPNAHQKNRISWNFENDIDIRQTQLIAIHLWIIFCRILQIEHLNHDHFKWFGSLELSAQKIENVNDSNL